MKKLTKNILEKNCIELIAKDEIFNQYFSWTKYFLSNHGRLIHKNNKGKYKIVNPSVSIGGYLSYTLSKPARTYRGEKVKDKNGKVKQVKKCYPAHQMVQLLYGYNPYPDEYTVGDLDTHHKDKNRKNNYYKNLMFLCRQKNGRKDHAFIHSIKKIALYNEKTCQYHTYKDIEVLMKRIGIDVLELIDSLRLNNKLFRDDKWNVYHVNGYFIGVQFYK